MKYQNILPSIKSIEWSEVKFPATFPFGEAKVACDVTISPTGAILAVKQGNIVIPSEKWLSCSAGNSVVALVVKGLSYENWL
jgi:hypothetical protein